MSGIEVLPALPKVEQTPTGLTLPEGMSFDEWMHVGEELRKVHTTVLWAIADWLFYGEWEFGRKYEAALDLTGLSYGTLADLKYVAGRFGHDRRRERLSLAHHREVASLPPDEADHWLDKAEDERWSQKGLRDQIAHARTSRTPSLASTPANEQLVLLLVYERIARWRAAAQNDGLDVEDWIVKVCDAAST